MNSDPPSSSRGPTPADEPPDGGKRQFGGSASSWMRFSGAGLELAVITIAFGAAGAFADRRLNFQRPVLSALAGLIGFTLGMIRFIRLALAASESDRMGRDDEGDRADSPGRR